MNFSFAADSQAIEWLVSKPVSRIGERLMKPILATAGLLGGLFWMALAFFPPVGVRETRADELMYSVKRGSKNAITYSNYAG